MNSMHPFADRRNSRLGLLLLAALALTSHVSSAMPACSDVKNPKAARAYMNKRKDHYAELRFDAQGRFHLFECWTTDSADFPETVEKDPKGKPFCSFFGRNEGYPMQALADAARAAKETLKEVEKKNPNWKQDWETNRVIKRASSYIDAGKIRGSEEEYKTVSDALLREQAFGPLVKALDLSTKGAPQSCDLGDKAQLRSNVGPSVDAVERAAAAVPQEKKLRDHAQARGRLGRPAGLVQGAREAAEPAPGQALVQNPKARPA